MKKLVMLLMGMCMVLIAVMAHSMNTSAESDCIHPAKVITYVGNKIVYTQNESDNCYNIYTENHVYCPDCGYEENFTEDSYMSVSHSWTRVVIDKTENYITYREDCTNSGCSCFYYYTDGIMPKKISRLLNY